MRPMRVVTPLALSKTEFESNPEATEILGTLLGEDVT